MHVVLLLERPMLGRALAVRAVSEILVGTLAERYFEAFFAVGTGLRNEPVTVRFQRALDVLQHGNAPLFGGKGTDPDYTPVRRPVKKFSEKSVQRTQESFFRHVPDANGDVMSAAGADALGLSDIHQPSLDR
jgi:hypothetical protein